MNLSKCFKMLLSLYLLIFTLPACSTPTPSLTVPPAPEPTATRLPTHTYMPPGSEILLDDARMACDQAFQVEVIGGSITAPVLALLRTDYGQTGWTVHPLPHITARFAPDVGVLVCIVQSRTKDGTYLDGSYGYQLSWKVRLVSWPTGSVISERSLPRRQVSCDQVGLRCRLRHPTPKPISFLVLWPGPSPVCHRSPDQL